MPNPRRLLLPALCLTGAQVLGQTATLDRDRDPVVIGGGSLDQLVTLPVAEIVAFRYEAGWQQIAVQIDERKVVDFGTVYDEPPVGIVVPAYADATTYTGPDADPTFDADDEIVFRAADAGDRAPGDAGLPPGVLEGAAAVEVALTDPLDGGTGYVYLSQTDGSLTPDAGQDYVTYDFNLLAGDYIPNYSTLAGPNPEDSEASSPYYRTHFSDRWIRDELNVFEGGATGVDVLDRHKNMFAPGNCSRTEDTFSNGEGAFFANLDGPVRAVRSYMGANSGPFTQRDHLFYERRQDITTYLRVHAISGIVDLYDYSPEAMGMSYHNDLNTSGVIVDGQPDAVAPGPIEWDMVTGPQGTLVISHSLITDVDPFAFTSYYSDDDTPSVTQCTGDDFEYATSGLWVDQAIPNTDPYLGPHNIMVARRTVYYEGPDQAVATAALLHHQAQAPLQVSIRTYPMLLGDFDGDDDVDLDDFAHWEDCTTGPDAAAGGQGCDAFDFDADSDVDLGDFAAFQRSIPD